MEAGGPLKTPADIAADTNYGQTEPRPVDYRNHKAITGDDGTYSPSVLQGVSLQYKAAFRVNGKTYYPGKK